MIKVAYDNVLLCPKCDGDNLHHSSVEVIVRDGEDGPGTSALSSRDGTTVSRVDASEIIGRRNAMVVSFWCEECGDLDERLSIYQHKGCTIIDW